MNTSSLSPFCNSSFLDAWLNEQDPNRKRLLLLGILVIATTLNDVQTLEAWLPRSEGVLDQTAVEEAVLQTLLFAGFPKTIEALKQVRKYFPQTSSQVHVPDHREAGYTTSGVIYGKHHSRLIQVMDELHPDLTRWMIEAGYGRVLSRPGLSLQDREMAVVATLMASGMVSQYRAHIRGALFVGVSVDDIIWFTNTFHCIIATDLRAAFEKARAQILTPD